MIEDKRPYTIPYPERSNPFTVVGPGVRKECNTYDDAYKLMRALNAAANHAAADLAAVTAERDAARHSLAEACSQYQTLKEGASVNQELGATLIRQRDAAALERDALAARCRELEGALEDAWGIIANAHGGNWSLSVSGWSEAAARFRDKYHALLTPATPAAKPETTETTETPVVAADTPEHISISVSGNLYSVPRAVADCICESRKAMVLAATEIKEWRTSWRLTNFELVAARKGTDENPTLAEMLKERPSRMWGVIRAEHEAKQTTETPAFKPRRFVKKSATNCYWQTEPNGKIGIYLDGDRDGVGAYDLSELTDPAWGFTEVPIPAETPAPTCGTCGGTGSVCATPDKSVVDPDMHFVPCPDCATAEGGVGAPTDTTTT